MIHKPAQWPSSSGVFNVPRTLVMTTAPSDEMSRGADTMFVGTPLDLIRFLEDRKGGVVTVVLTGRFAMDPEMSEFLRETYPSIELVVERSHVDTDVTSSRTALVA